MQPFNPLGPLVVFANLRYSIFAPYCQNIGSKGTRTWAASCSAASPTRMFHALAFIAYAPHLPLRGYSSLYMRFWFARGYLIFPIADRFQYSQDRNIITVNERWTWPAVCCHESSMVFGVGRTHGVCWPALVQWAPFVRALPRLKMCGYGAVRRKRKAPSSLLLTCAS